MRVLYSLAWLLALPIAFIYLLWRGRRQSAYRQHWLERLGFAPQSGNRPVIWIHAVSVGETRAAAPLISALRSRYPDHDVLLTHATPTGRATGQELFGALFGTSLRQTYLPYDVPPLVWLFLKRVRPVLGVVMETEIWPNLFRACHAHSIPLMLANTRLSERSLRGYLRFAPLVRGALHDLSGIAAQTQADADRLAQLGAESTIVTGNIKFDVPQPLNASAQAAILRTHFCDRFVLLCASTREGEEALLLQALLEGEDTLGAAKGVSKDAQNDARSGSSSWLIVLVPRHPQRFEEVADFLKQKGISYVRRSENSPISAETQVFLGDSMGELAGYYGAADICFVGGSLVPLGGQNLIEAAAAGCPALIGPHTWNFYEIAEQAVACGAAVRINNAEELREHALRLYANASTRQEMKQAGYDFTLANRGATARTMHLIESIGPH